MKFEGPTPPTFCGIPLKGSPEYYYGRTDVADCHIFQEHLGLWKGRITIFVPGAELHFREQDISEERVQTKLKEAFLDGQERLKDLARAYQVTKVNSGS